MHVRLLTNTYTICLYAYVSQAKNPEKYPVDTKPLEINLYNTALHLRAPAQYIPGSASAPMPSLAFPYGYYPSPYGLPPTAGYLPVQQHVLHGGYAQPPMGYAPPPGPSAPKQAIKYPMILAWLKYCDWHPQHCREDFSNHVLKFNKEGYHCIHWLTGDQIMVEKLSDWLNIGKGMVDLLICYAEEDVELMKADAFTMVLADDGAQDAL